MAEVPHLSDNLHRKPICARFMRTAMNTATTVQLNVSPTKWHGRLVITISKGGILVASLLLIPFALIEAATLFVFSGIGISANKLLCHNRSAFLQKNSLKALSYAFHSTVIALIGIATPILFVWGSKFNIRHRLDFRYHTPNALVDHAIHLGSAAAIHLILRDKANPQPAFSRALNLFKDSHPTLLRDIFKQVDRDLQGTTNLHALAQLPHLSTYFNTHPEDLALINHFQFETFLSDSSYRERIARLVQDILATNGLTRPLSGPDANPFLFEPSQFTGEEMAYQDALYSHLEAAVVKIHGDPELSVCLNMNGQKGGKALEEQEPTVFIPVATYAQFLELKGLLTCPRSFTTYSLNPRYNGRYAALTEAKQKLDRLLRPDPKNPNQAAAREKELTKKILSGADYQVEDATVKEVYWSISALSPPLYQGPLMVRKALNLSPDELRNGGQIRADRNLFGEAWTRGIERAKKEEAKQRLAAAS